MIKAAAAAAAAAATTTTTTMLFRGTYPGAAELHGLLVAKPYAARLL